MSSHTPDIVTLDNLSQTITPWDPQGESQLYAIVDMGSNGIRFSITSLAPPFTRLLRPIYSTRAAISLFDALKNTPKGLVFLPETIAAVSKTLERFHQLAVRHGVPAKHITILATEAMRRADNASEMLEAISSVTNGLRASILEPAVETLFGAVMGSRSGLIGVEGGALFLDLGGGSVQMTWVDTSKPNYEVDAARAGVSLPFGAARLIRVLQEQPADVQVSEISKLQTGMQQAYANLCSKFSALNALKSSHDEGPRVNVFMCGGGFRGYGSMLMHQDPVSPYPIPYTNGYTAPVEFSDSKRRRKQFPAIATVIDALLATVPNIGNVTFCGGSNRQGALMMKLPVEIRECNPLDILARVTPDEKPVFDAVLNTLRSALPAEVDFSSMPDVLTPGLDSLFVREIWTRQGHDSDNNSSFALHHAITRDAEVPGLSHTGRALLALSASARWGGILGPLDSQLQQSLSALLGSQHLDAPFWASYIGAVAGLIAIVLPIIPTTAEEVENAISIKAHLKRAEDKKERIVLTIRVASANIASVSLEDLADRVEKTAKKNGGKKPRYKITAQVSPLPCHISSST
ncbi:retrograde regulation protein 2 [Fusarium verticillioides 7600]|uniref:Retrograde regulation protein 2 n=1 Tax=Gibberella moniliformis (strain M3125 / FGSC 7600) TaxID=334819 RepID=W7LDJ4_GIBM7|nr:retrograde regulation protein 2 [Fusarium verticillioides 7600]EWG37518.1 retrograde regulation protein 2 [Fusarium verticillioides 7600]